MDIWDILFFAVLVVFALSAAWEWRELYEWFVEPAKGRWHRGTDGTRKGTQ